jgi:hypothetical protein
MGKLEILTERHGRKGPPAGNNTRRKGEMLKYD